MMRMIPEIDLSSSQKKALVDLACDMIRLKTVASNEAAIVEIIKNIFDGANIRRHIIEPEQGRASIIGFIGSKRPRLMLAAHTDTVAPGSGWKTDPFKPVIRNGRLYGRGSVDDKGPLASLIAAALILKQYEAKLRGSLVIAALADEESGSKLGLGYMFNSELWRSIKPDYAVVADTAHNMHAIDIAEKGVLRISVRCIGKAAHGASPQKGVNAINAMAELITLLEKHRMRFKKHTLLSPPTISTGMINGGSAPNMVADACEATLDIRYLPSQKPSGITREIKQLCLRVQKKRGCSFTLSKTLEMKPTETNKDSSLIKCLTKAAEVVAGIKPRLIGLSGATDAKRLILAGVPAIGFGPGDEDAAHAANESVDIKELYEFARVCVLTGFELLL